MTKLLNKPLKVFTIYALIILVISIPAYVLVVDFIWITELDENNWLTLQYTKNKLEAETFTEDDLEKINHIWGELQPGVSISKVEDNFSLQDSVYEAIRTNEYDPDDGEDRFRGLISYVVINGETYQLTIETNVEESDETFVAVAIVTLVFFAILIVGFIILNRKLSKNTWKPFYQTLSSLQSFELSKDRTLKLPETDIEEFQELNNSIEQLVKRNVDTYQLQKSFTENASHELQTPIALLKSKLDLLFQEKDVTPAISEILSSIEMPLSRLSRINKNLLLLAKVENQQYTEQEELSVKEYVENSLLLFEDYIEDKQITVCSDIENAIQVNTNPFLLETLTHNLLSNAIRHTQTEGAILIKLEANTLLFSNSGKAALDIKQLFQRFSMASKDKISSGLGLAIVNEIAKRENWKIDYYFENDYHTFSVEF
ncbi:MAG: hypothetical protein CMO01_24515 [Thalassobius sp.]|nr:hypothetical protein [Thalassovita sp.]